MGDALPYDLRLVLVRVRAVKAKRAHQLSLAQASSRDISSLVRDGLLRDCYTGNVFVIIVAILQSISTRVYGIYHTAAAGQCRHHAAGCALTPHVLRGTPRLLAQEQSLSSVLVGWWFGAGAGDSALGTSRFAAPARAK